MEVEKVYNEYGEGYIICILSMYEVYILYIFEEKGRKSKIRRRSCLLDMSLRRSNPRQSIHRIFPVYFLSKAATLMTAYSVSCMRTERATLTAIHSAYQHVSLGTTSTGADSSGVRGTVFQVTLRVVVWSCRRRLSLFSLRLCRP